MPVIRLGITIPVNGGQTKLYSKWRTNKTELKNLDEYSLITFMYILCLLILDKIVEVSLQMII